MKATKQFFYAAIEENLKNTIGAFFLFFSLAFEFFDFPAERTQYSLAQLRAKLILGNTTGSARTEQLFLFFSAVNSAERTQADFVPTGTKRLLGNTSRTVQTALKICKKYMNSRKNSKKSAELLKLIFLKF